MKVEAIVIHHTASPADVTTLERVTEWHLERGFSTVGYHYLIEWRDGEAKVRKGRDETRNGAHTLGGWNSKSLGVCLAGSFEKPGAQVPQPQWEAAQTLCVELCRRYGLTAADVHGHGELWSTQCPGFQMHVFRSDLERRLR